MRISVLRGGPGAYHASLESGQYVLGNLKNRHQVVDVLIDRDGLWHVGGLPTLPERALQTADVVFNCLHGIYGEDGGVQDLLDKLKYRYTGSGKLTCALAYNKSLAKRVLKRAGLRVPKGICINTKNDPYEIAEQLFQTIGGQYVIKPVRGSMSEGVRVVRSHGELVGAITQSLWQDGEIIVEELVRGREVKMGVVDGLRGSDSYVLLPVEVIREGQTSIYIPIGGNNFMVPCRLSKTEKEDLKQVALCAYRAIGSRGYAMVDIILSSRGPVVLEVDTHPNLGQHSPMQAGLDALGVSDEEFLDHLVTTA
ncbi:MAG TPA: ATP-grasp domain-containing protein [Candidatus Paceibacterota bacterium]